MNIQHKIQTIRQKLEAINQLRASKDGSPYKFNPVLSEVEIQAFETKHSITLPEEYRAFLLEVGNGNNLKWSRSIRPLKGVDKLFYTDAEELNLKAPFPFDEENGLWIVKTQIEEDRYPANNVLNFIEASGMDADKPTGCLILNYEGSYNNFIALVVSGSERGRVWNVGEIYTPVYAQEGHQLRIFSFLDWVEDDLDYELKPSSISLMRAGRFEEVTSLDLYNDKTWQKDFSIEDIFKCGNLISLNLTGNTQFTTLPESIENLRKLVHLKFSSGQLKSLPATIGKLENLEVLDLGYQNLRSLPNTIGNLKNLKKLYLSWNPYLRHLPVSLGKIKSLVTLSIDSCHRLNVTQALPIIGKLPSLKGVVLHINEVPAQIECLCNIESLSLGAEWGDWKVNIPHNISKLKNLKTLYLSHCGLTELPGFVCELSSLEVLFLDKNPLTALPESIGKLSNLKYLTLEKTHIEKLPESFTLLRNLEEVGLRGVEELSLKNVCDIFSYLPEIRKLQVDIHQKIPDNIGSLKHLKELVIVSEYKRPQVFPASIVALKNLELLQIDSDTALTMPAEFVGLEQLRTLLIDLDGKKLNLPENFGELRNLVELNITDVRMAHLPASFDKLRSLQTLYLRNIPDMDWADAFQKIAGLPKLKELVISANLLPPEIGSLINLKMLILSGEKLKQVPSEIGNLKNLIFLDLSGQKLRVLPESIGNLKQLRELNVSYNELSTLPESIGSLTNLCELDLGDNKLVSLPDSTGRLQNLLRLVLFRNKLKTIPDSIGNLQNLRYLDIHENGLQSLPDSIGELQSLSYLNVRKNKLKGLPRSLSRMTFSDGLHYDENPFKM